MATTRPLCDSSSYTARLIRTTSAQPKAVVQSGDDIVFVPDIELRRSASAPQISRHPSSGTATLPAGRVSPGIKTRYRTVEITAATDGSFSRRRRAVVVVGIPHCQHALLIAVQLSPDSPIAPQARGIFSGPGPSL